VCLHQACARTSGQAARPGRLLPHGRATEIDYADFLKSGQRMYLASAQPIKASTLGHVIAHLRSSLAAEEDQQDAEPPLVNRTASFRAAGSATYQIRGDRLRCRLAAYLRGWLHVCLAQTTVHHRTAPMPCAVRQTPPPPR
jgi:hypothetical protein